MDLRVNDDAMKALVAKAIVDSLTEETRNTLIANAVQAAITVPEQGSGYYGNKRSPIQQAFDRAVEQQANEFARTALAGNSEFKTKVEALFADVAKKLFETNERDELVTALANTITRALTKDRY